MLRPTAVVAMGDSEAAGVGGTAPGTRAGGSASCARSDDGWPYQLTSSASTRVDLACSGAKTLDVLNTGADRGTQPAQAAALAATASANRVTTVVVRVGANDAGFSSSCRRASPPSSRRADRPARTSSPPPWTAA